VSRSGDPRAELADIARQARDLLERVRESRWPGFEPVAAQTRKDAACPTSPDKSQRRVTAAARPAPRRPAPPPAVQTPSQPETPPSWRSLDDIAQAVRACTKCPLHAKRTNAVPGEGNPKARLMFVGEAPGADEDRLGRPFVGAAGKLLDKMIAAMGLAREEVFIANVLKCRPPGNRDPQEGEVTACLPYLRAQIGLIRPEIICALGKHSAHALLGRRDPIGQLRGRFFEYCGTPLLPTFHPSYLLRSPGEKKTAWLDLQQIMQRLGLKPPDPQQEQGRAK
jgi:DNA polymerase